MYNKKPFQAFCISATAVLRVSIIPLSKAPLRSRLTATERTWCLDLTVCETSQTNTGREMEEKILQRARRPSVAETIEPLSQVLSAESSEIDHVMK